MCGHVVFPRACQTAGIGPGWHWVLSKSRQHSVRNNTGSAYGFGSKHRGAFCVLICQLWRPTEKTGGILLHVGSTFSSLFGKIYMSRWQDSKISPIESKQNKNKQLKKVCSEATLFSVCGLNTLCTESSHPVPPFHASLHGTTKVQISWLMVWLGSMHATSTWPSFFSRRHRLTRAAPYPQLLWTELNSNK